MNINASPRNCRGILTIWIIVTFTFIALNLSGDPIEALVGDQASPAVIAHYREKFGLDQPLWEQYLVYFGNICRAISVSRCRIRSPHSS